MNHYRLIQRCLSCDSSSLQSVLDLGNQPLANAYRLELVEENETLFPLEFRLCTDCFHGQLSVAVDPETLYSDYAYVSGTTRSLRQNFEELARYLAERFKRPRVLDIAANDGTFVLVLKNFGIEAIGIDPAKNLVEAAQKNGINVVQGFWSSEFAEDYKNQFDVITAMNVLAHVGNPLDFLLGCKKALAENGSIFIQTSQALMVNNGEFDTIYHEHHSFFNTNSLKRLASRAGLHVVDGDYTPIHGTSYRWELRHSPSSKNLDILHDEERRGIYSLDTYSFFASKARSVVDNVRRIVDDARLEGFVISSYGAAAKSQTFNNFALIRPDIVIDDNPLKVGRFTPGSGVAIQDANSLSAIDRPIQHIIGAWNFAEEIQEKLRLIRGNQSGDRCLVYFPDVVNHHLQR
jgi:2-polyprenyl-3-methyl-5-hydroxy-6-metoxy-1,4-benzoquinol methylase